jgi:hypothetical protein
MEKVKGWDHQHLSIDWSQSIYGNFDCQLRTLYTIHVNHIRCICTKKSLIAVGFDAVPFLSKVGVQRRDAWKESDRQAYDAVSSYMF